MDCSLSGSSVPEILQDHWRRLPFPSQGVFPHTGIEPRSPALQMDSLLAEPPGKPRAVLALQKNLVESPRELPYAVDASYWLLVSQVTQLVKKKNLKSVCQGRRCQRHGLDPWVRKITWSRKWQPTSQLSCLENSMDRGAWWAVVHGVAKSRTQLSMHTTKHFIPTGSKASDSNTQGLEIFWKKKNPESPKKKKFKFVVCWQIVT